AFVTPMRRRLVHVNVRRETGKTSAAVSASDPAAVVVDGWTMSGFPQNDGLTGPSLAPGDELIGNVVQVIADDLRLRPDSQDLVRRAPDQCRFPAGRYRAECVPGVARDQAELRRLDPKFPLDIGIGLTGRLMVLHAVRAEAPLEKIDNAALFKLTG